MTIFSRRYLKKFILSSVGFVTKLDSKHGGRRIVNAKGFLFYFCKSAIISFNLRPRYASQFYCVGNEVSCNDLAIVIQGPILYDDDFTLETIKIYQKIFPEAFIIISTWLGIQKNFYSKIQELGCHVILNKEPIDKGFGNINMQIVSTLAGLKKAQSLGAKYVIKNRTDWRIYSPDSYIFLKNLIDIFPLDVDCQIRNRIISSEMTCKHRVYGLTDTFQFGLTEDLLVYWDVGDWVTELNNNFEGQRLINSTPLICEIFLCALFLKKVGHSLEWSLKSWWCALKKYFIVIDHSSLDMIFYKYDFNFEQRRSRGYLDRYSRAVSFIDWINLYSGSINGWVDTNQNLTEIWEVDSEGEFNQKQV